MPTVLIVASTTGYQTRMFLDAAERLHYDAVLATDRCHVLDDPWADRALPLRFDDPESMLELDRRVDGIVALGDRPAYFAARIAQRFGLKFHRVEAVEKCGNKFEARAAFTAAGLPVPGFFRIPLAEKAGETACPTTKIEYPCVLKPLGLSGSRGVIRANDPAEFVQAYRRIETLLNSVDILRMRVEQDRFVQVETFIPGREYALEGIATGGSLRVIAVFDKPDPLDGPFFEETIYVTPARVSAGVRQAIDQATQAAIRALGLTDGPVHAEMRVNELGVWMLEVAARPIGGLCARVLPGLPELILRHAVGDTIDLTSLSVDARGVMMIPIPREGVYVDVSGVAEARRLSGIEDVVITAKQGQHLVPLPEGNSYLGFIFAAGAGPEEVESRLRAAHAGLSFSIATALPVL